MSIDLNMNLIKILIIIAIMLAENNSAARHTIPKLIYQMDVSEHCRRRVLPSIFLGRQVVNANSQILQFSRLELPYSCFISIRTESGSNMIMMIQLATDDIKKSCSKNSEQLLVYEIGETFGGYWGPLPDSIMNQTPYNNSNFYTVKTTHTTIPSTLSDEPEEKRQKLFAQPTETKANETESKHESEDYVVVAEIPIVNVSVHLVPGGPQRPGKAFDPEVAFDVENDVTPIPGVSYDTKILPLVQFSLREDMTARRGEDDAPKYELDIFGDFTPDMRLTLPQLSSTKARKSYYDRRYQATRRLNFKKHKNFIDTEKYQNRQIVSGTFTKYEFPTKRTTAQTRSTQFNESWYIIEDIIKKLEVNAGHTNTTSPEEAFVLDQIAKLDHNKSAYLLPQWSHKYDWKINKIKKSTTLSYHELNNFEHKKKLIAPNTVHTTVTFKSDFISSKGSTNISSNDSNTTQAYYNQGPPDILDEKKDYLTNTSKDSKEIENSISESSTAINKNHNKLIGKVTGVTIDITNESTLTGSMVGHESWENVVQAAPEMASKLNRSVAYDTTTPQLNDSQYDDRLLRKKREIHSINIENARPHDMTIKVEKTTTTTSQFQIADMQEFAQLVELQDNELHGRVALRYLRQYVGPALFNLCDLAETTPRHVHLFNSSRIVMAITNFTLDRMIIILTSARTLLSGETSCPTTHLECQVSGARVCLDSSVACDGVPNCGSYDIYDEDRLLCGAGKSLQHNVYLAAFTFLAALLTILYVVHYWLKRCVPKVADAFFVYTNGIENALYLDTIMRCPNDTDDMSKTIYHGAILRDDDMYNDLDIAIEPNLCKRFFKKCCFCCKRQTKKNDNLSEEGEESFTNLQRKRLYSFTYSDINEMFSLTRDTAIQTGESLEMQFLKEMNKVSKIENNVGRRGMIQSPSPPLLIQDSILTLEEPLPKEDDELSLMKFFRAARNNDTLISDSSDLDGNAKLKGKNEIELTTHNYDSARENEPGPSGVTAAPKKATSSHKHLRFDEVMTMIPIKDDEDEEDQDADHHRSVQILDNKNRRTAQHLDTIDENEEQTTRHKDTLHFWGSSKLKKLKKKPQNPR